ncbi:hypothetical protein GLOIN_2v1786037 [Rhizophagus clarus]|uniref:Uncharacterized protein n=1 Tax=Rhizophagus clarus TaxID=94130 RepID=A0A8H3MC17_9GLOM|nr:hypothetical protein GLOIN_2v1786037 [Rhizophagus clarus]
MKRKIDNLQDRVRRVEEENSLLRQFNEIFGDESNQLCEENKTLQEELQRLKQLCTPRKTINSPQQYSPKRPNKRLKLREKSPDEVAASAARDEMKNLLKGQIPEEYQLDYGKTFSEQTAKIYEKLIPELKRLMSGHYNLSEFDKDELLPMLVQNDCHSIEQSDSEDDSRQKLPDNKQFLHVYDRSWRSVEERIYNDDIYFMSSKPLENAPEWALDKMKMYETDETNETIGVSEYDDMVDDLIQSYEDHVPIELNLTEPYSDFLLNSVEMNSTRPEDLDEIGESLTTQQKAEKN